MSNAPKKDSLGDRQKRYETVYEQQLVPRVPVILRCDGNCFHTWTKGLQRPFDDNLRDCMEYAAFRLLSEISGARFAYVQSDEISILIVDYRELNTEGWFDYRVFKMATVAASICSNGFNEKAQELLPQHYAKKGPAAFDARVFNVPIDDVTNNFLWRQRDCEKNSISSLAQANFPYKELLNKNSSQKQDMLMAQKKINWNDVPVRFKRGTALFKIQVTLPAVNPKYPGCASAFRTKWIADHAMPVISRDRDYVERWLVPDPEPINDPKPSYKELSKKRG